MRKFFTQLILLLSLLALPGCGAEMVSDENVATTESWDNEWEEEYIEDPLIEGFNEVMFEFNLFLDDYFFAPAAKATQALLPEPALQMMHNFVYNLYSPFSAVNFMLQGRFHDMFENVAAFMINSTLGVGGLLPITNEIELYPKYSDFGLTLAYWGVPKGPMFMLPALGPMYIRDFLGFGAKFIADPVTIVLNKTDNSHLQIPLQALDLLTLRIEQGPQIDYARETAYDFYTTFKIMYEQRRDALLYD